MKPSQKREFLCIASRLRKMTEHFYLSSRVYNKLLARQALSLVSRAISGNIKRGLAVSATIPIAAWLLHYLARASAPLRKLPTLEP